MNIGPLVAGIVKEGGIDIATLGVWDVPKDGDHDIVYEPVQEGENELVQDPVQEPVQEPVHELVTEVVPVTEVDVE